MTTTAARLDAITAQLGTITPGPWEHEPYGGQNQNGDYAGGNIFDGHGEYLISEVSDKDGAFIASAPETVHYLLTLARKQAAALERVEKVRQELFDLSNDDGWTTQTRAAYRDASRAIYTAITGEASL